ncbi:MAG: hypothetical protein ACJ763_20245 [Bdellovibrionia bacterium]
MKNLFILTAFILNLFFTPRLSIAGADTHGGGSIVCRDRNGMIKTDPLSVELLDLWEAEAVFKYHVVRTNEPWEVQAKEAIEKLRLWDFDLVSEAVPYLGIPLWNDADIQHEREAINRHVPYRDLVIVDIQDPRAGGMGIGIASPNDTRAGFTKKGCALEGAATFNDAKNYLIVDTEIVSKMAPTDYAALRVHEAVYRALRTLKGVTDSLLARAITGMLFTTEPLLNGSANAIPPEAKVCSSRNGDYVFSLFPKEEKLFLQFKVMRGLPVIDSSYSEIPATSDRFAATDSSNRIRAAMEEMLLGNNPTFFIGPHNGEWRDDCLSVSKRAASNERHPWNASDDRVCFGKVETSLSSAIYCY